MPDPMGYINDNPCDCCPNFECEDKCAYLRLDKSQEDYDEHEFYIA